MQILNRVQLCCLFIPAMHPHAAPLCIDVVCYSLSRHCTYCTVYIHTLHTICHSNTAKPSPIAMQTPPFTGPKSRALVPLFLCIAPVVQQQHPVHTRVLPSLLGGACAAQRLASLASHAPSASRWRGKRLGLRPSSYVDSRIPFHFTALFLPLTAFCNPTRRSVHQRQSRA